MKTNKTTYLNWTKEKPVFDNKSKECLLLVANKCQEWNYTLFEMKKIDFEENWYWGILNEYGDEWGDYADLEAELYCQLPLIKREQMIKIKITEKGIQLIADADKQGGIYPNHIYLLSAIKDGREYDEGILKKQLNLTGWSECVHWLSRNSMIECSA